MLRWLWRVFVVLVLAALMVWVGDAQDKTKDPKVVLELEKPAPSEKSAANVPEGAKTSVHVAATGPFGKTCSAFGSPKDGYRSLDGAASIADLIGAPIEVVKIRRYGSGSEKADRDEVRKHVLKLLAEETSEEYRYEPWDEAVYAGLVAKIQFFDHTEGVLEESGNHVCFSDFNGQVWWTRIPPPAVQ
jgi:hypothetical protein